MRILGAIVEPTTGLLAIGVADLSSALADGADLFKVMDVARHREVKTLKAYDRRAKAFKDHAGKGFL